jgi:hypothetical protein
MKAIPTLARLVLVAALTLILAPAHAQSVGAPLSLLPPAAKAKKHVVKQTAPRATAVRRTVRRTNTPTATAQTTANVMGGDTSVALTAQLPWWRSDEKTAMRHREEAAESQILSAADTWIESSISGVGAYAAASAAQFDAAFSAGDPPIVAAGDFNPLDRVAPDLPPADRSGRYGLLALLAGALAAAAAAAFLFLRRPGGMAAAP